MNVKSKYFSDMRAQCAEVLWREVSALQLESACARVGLDPQSTSLDPMNSKRSYVHSILDRMDIKSALNSARSIADEYDDFSLKEIVSKLECSDRPGISELTRRELLRALDDIEISGHIDLLDFLGELWPLEKMDESGNIIAQPASYEFVTLCEEIHRHCVRFSDWTNNQLLTKLGLLRCSDKLLFKFIEMCVHPRTRGEGEQFRVAKIITEAIQRDAFAVAEVERQSGYPIFKVVPTAKLGANPSSNDVSTILASFDEQGIHSVWEKAMSRKNNDPEGAITIARTLLETVCKHVLDEQEIPYKSGDELPKLWKACAESLNLAPSQHTLEPFKQVLGGCSSIVQGLGTIRNKIGDAHGQGRRPVRPKPRHAALAVDLAGAMATFIVSTFRDRPKP